MPLYGKDIKLFKVKGNKKNEEFFKKLTTDCIDRIAPFRPDDEEILKLLPKNISIEYLLYDRNGNDHNYNEIIGSLTIYGITENDCYVGCFIKQEHEGHNYATKAHKEILDFIKTCLKISIVKGHVLADNIKSIGLVEKLGFKREAKAIEMKCQGQPRDFLEYWIEL